MSHFIVAVFTEQGGLSVEELLAPYGPEVNAPDTRKWDSWKVEEMHTDCLLKLKGSRKLVSSAKVKDIDFSRNEELYKKALREWDITVEHKPVGKEEKRKLPLLFKEEYYLERYESREKFADQASRFCTYAVVTPDGKWHECGQMGWFGLGNETPEQARDWDENYARNFLETADPEWTLTLINCHI